MNERRTEAGALLRTGLEEMERQIKAVPTGRKGTVVVVWTNDQVALGTAWHTARGWDISASLSAAVTDGKARDLTFTVGLVL
ncbi:hypothetical protein [Luteitalea sp.]|uniref:hypothetical protein n=1 Tax=Luteitalea sp. TaxID=2004800 RepID=UPI0025C494BC|nr:hypothetical protein [Luteitalea sp.]